MSSLCDFLDGYLELVDDTESPILYHRWSILTAIGAMLARRVVLDFSIGSVYPNQYVILLGPPASRKNTAIDIAVNLVRSAGYGRIASGSTSPEQFLVDLNEGFDNLDKTAGHLDNFGEFEDLDLGISSATSYGHAKTSDVLIAEGELLSFLGHNNISFSKNLLNLWDNKGHHDVRTRSGDRFRIQNPTLSLLGGATQSTFKQIFPYDITGQGLLSRIILVYGAGPTKKVFDPENFDVNLISELKSYLTRLLVEPKSCKKYRFSARAYDYAKHLYESNNCDLLDPRFVYYNGRRDTHFKKLCLTIASLNFHKEIELSDCLLANTILTYTEQFMPSALGEFGLSKTDEQTELVYSVIRKSEHGLYLQDILHRTVSIIGKPQELTGHLVRLLATERVDKISQNGKIRYVAVDRIVEQNTDLVDYNLLKEYITDPNFYHTTDTKTLELRKQETELAKEVESIVSETKKGPIQKSIRGVKGVSKKPALSLKL